MHNKLFVKNKYFFPNIYYNMFEYDDIKKFIENDILNTRLINNSYIEKDSVGGMYGLFSDKISSINSKPNTESKFTLLEPNYKDINSYKDNIIDETNKITKDCSELTNFIPIFNANYMHNKYFSQNIECNNNESYTKLINKISNEEFNLIKDNIELHVKNFYTNNFIRKMNNFFKTSTLNIYQDFYIDKFIKYNNIIDTNKNKIKDNQYYSNYLYICQCYHQEYLKLLVEKNKNLLNNEYEKINTYYNGLKDKSIINNNKILQQYYFKKYIDITSRNIKEKTEEKKINSIIYLFKNIIDNYELSNDDVLDYLKKTYTDNNKITNYLYEINVDKLIFDINKNIYIYYYLNFIINICIPKIQELFFTSISNYYKEMSITIEEEEEKKVYEYIKNQLNDIYQNNNIIDALKTLIKQIIIIFNNIQLFNYFIINKNIINNISQEKYNFEITLEQNLENNIEIYTKLCKKFYLYNKIFLLINEMNNFDKENNNNTFNIDKKYFELKKKYDTEIERLKQMGIDFSIKYSFTIEKFKDMLITNYTEFDELYKILFDIVNIISDNIKSTYLLKKIINESNIVKYNAQYYNDRIMTKYNYLQMNDNLYNLNNENFINIFEDTDKINELSQKKTIDFKDHINLEKDNILFYLFECEEEEETFCKSLFLLYKLNNKDKDKDKINNKNYKSDILPGHDKIFNKLIFTYNKSEDQSDEKLKQIFENVKSLIYLEIILKRIYKISDITWFEDIFTMLSENELKINKEILKKKLNIENTENTGCIIIIKDKKAKYEEINSSQDFTVEMASSYVFWNQEYNDNFNTLYKNIIKPNQIKIYNTIDCFMNTTYITSNINPKFKNMIMLFFLLIIIVIYKYNNKLLYNIKTFSTMLINISIFIVSFIIPVEIKSNISIYSYYFEFFKQLVICLSKLITYSMLYDVAMVGSIGTLAYYTGSKSLEYLKNPVQSGGFKFIEHLLSYINTETIKNKIINSISYTRDILNKPFNSSNNINNDIEITDKDIENIKDENNNLTETNDIIIKSYKKKYSFNQDTGLIEYNNNDKNDFNHIITSICHTEYYDIKEIYMITKKDNSIVFDINNLIIDNTNNNISFIQNKPIHISLIMAYILSKKINFISNLNLDLNININSIIETNNNKNYDNVCTEIFGKNYNNETCSRHFYSILGKSGISMMNNLNQQNLTKTLINANPTIQYEILKNLDWKIKVKNNKKIFINVDEWLKIISSDKQKQLYTEYLNNNILVKNIINNIVNNLNKTNILNKIIINKVIVPHIERKKIKRININKNIKTQTINNFENPYFYSLNYYKNILNIPKFIYEK